MAFQFTQTGAELQDLIDRIYQIAEEYDPGTSYVIGDYCSYGGKIYRCTAATTGTFDATAWTDSVIVMDAIKTLKTRITQAESDISDAQGDISALNTSLAQTNTAISSTTGGVPLRRIGTVQNGQSLTISFVNDFSVNVEFALVCLNLSGNALSGTELLFLGRGTSKYKALLGGLSSSYYSCAYSDSAWTITNNAGNVMYYTAIISK